MTTALAGVSPEALAPGDPDGARALAARLEGYAEGAGAAAARLRALEAGTWVGEAAEAFRASLDTLPQRLSRASASFAEAASALRAYALAAEEARRRAALAVARFDDAQAATARWESQRADHDAALAAESSGGPPAGPGPSGHDPGAGTRRAAEGLAEELSADLEAAERALEQRLRRAAADAPDEPGFWDQAFRLGKELVGGAVEATVGLGEFAFKLTPTYALVDPEGYVEHLVGLGQGVAYGVTHPVEFAQAVTNWDLWLDNPARALGQLVPDLVLAVGTAGAGTAATAASRAARGAEKLDDVADGARAAERLAGADARRLDDAWQELGPSIRPEAGTQVYRVWGEAQDATGGLERGSRPWGASWTPVDPRTAPDFRSAAGLPDENPARFLSEGTLRRPENVTVREALPLDGNAGGWPEYLIDDAEDAVDLSNVSGINEAWTRGPGEWSPIDGGSGP